MIHEQRPLVDPMRAAAEPPELWRPPIAFEARPDREIGVSEEQLAALGYQPRFMPRPDDFYIAIDERVADTFGLVSLWPRVDGAGRLRFPDGDHIAWFAAEQLQTAIGRRRARRAQVTRFLRIGDVFWIRGFDKDPDVWNDLVDITEWARDATKIAVYSVATGPVPESAARLLGLVPKEEASDYR